MASKRKEKLSLAEQVAGLSNLLPDDFEDEINVAKISEDVNDTDGQRSLSAMILDEDDMRYEGRSISRHHLEQEWGIVSGKLTSSLTCFPKSNKASVVHVLKSYRVIVILSPPPLINRFIKCLYVL